MDWGNFAVIIGGCGRRAHRPVARRQAGQTLMLFAYPLLLSIALVIPGLPGTTLGVLLLLLALVAGVVFARAGRSSPASTACTG